MTRLPAVFKHCLQRTLNWLTGKHAVFLPAESAGGGTILNAVANYRVDASTVTVLLQEPNCGRLSAALFGYDGHFPTRAVWSGISDYCGPSELTLDLANGDVRLADRLLGCVPLPLPGRRFCWQLELTGGDGTRRRRLIGHYLPGNGMPASESYFHGDNYVDYEAQSEGESQMVLALIRQHECRGPVLEVGCASGGLLEALDKAGYMGVGVDLSGWAVEQVRGRLGPNRAFCCDVENDLPDAAARLGPFNTLLLWYVFEHLRDPFQTLARLTQYALPNARLIIGTTNADSLTNYLFGAQWEGHFDWTHHGVEQVGVRSIRKRLPQLGWRIEQLTTDRIWDCSADPTRATLREWWAADARFRQLLAERDLGDLIHCVAVYEAVGRS